MAANKKCIVCTGNINTTGDNFRYDEASDAYVHKRCVPLYNWNGRIRCDLTTAQAKEATYGVKL